MKLFNCKIINANNQQVVSNSNLAIPIIPFSRDGFDTWAVELKSKVTVMQIQVGDNKTFWGDGTWVTVQGDNVTYCTTVYARVPANLQQLKY